MMGLILLLCKNCWRLNHGSIAMRPITSGDDGGTPAKPDGLSGNICNVAFHKEPMTLEQIRWAYNMLRSQDPPMVGMKTIADEVKTTGTTNMYSR